MSTLLKEQDARFAPPPEDTGGSPSGDVLRPYLGFVTPTVCGSCLLPFMLWAYNVARLVVGKDSPTWDGLAGKLVSLVAITVAALWIVFYLPRRHGGTLERLASQQAECLRRYGPRQADWGIFLAAGLSLFLELSVIRWQSAVFELFAYYKNFSLLACFLGLGLGYALSSRPRIPLLLTIPLLAWQMVLFLATRYGPEGWHAGLLRATPVLEQLGMGVGMTEGYGYIAVLLLLVNVFLLTVLTFLPLGQLCGSLMERRPRLQAYGLNLLGSLAGVAVTFFLSLQWTPPAVWFGLGFLVLLMFQTFHRGLLFFGGVSCLIGLTALAWPVTPMWEQIHSPYQLLERGPGAHGLTTIRAAGHYFQRIQDFSATHNPDLQWITAYYSLPYRAHGKLDRVAVVGAGSGNDVAMALRMGARQVDAIEIDPAIMAIGANYHPNRPYSDPRVRPIVNDARSHLRSTDAEYDLIVYGLLDSHTLLSHGSSVRVDSFVYTVEGFREARARLKKGGCLSCAFCVLFPEQGHKIYLMLKEAFDGQAPTCVRADYDGAIIFLQREGQPITVSPALLAAARLKDATAEFADPNLHADLSTDDWPFFYMPKRVYPLSYVVILGFVLLLSVGLVVPFFNARPQVGQAPFFLLGAGFMLVETKAITELGLTFGNTWQVIGIVIAGILTMAFIANLVVQRWRINNLATPYTLLLASLALGLLVMSLGSFPPTLPGKLAAVTLLTVPMFFSGIVFSTLLQRTEDLSGAMAANLIGALVGGLLEYNSMYFGFLFLYWLALGIYAGAFALFLCRAKTA